MNVAESGVPLGGNVVIQTNQLFPPVRGRDRRRNKSPGPGPAAGWQRDHCQEGHRIGIDRNGSRIGHVWAVGEIGWIGVGKRTELSEVPSSPGRAGRGCTRAAAFSSRWDRHVEICRETIPAPFLGPEEET